MSELLPQAIAGRMEETHRNREDHCDIVETSEPSTITRAALNQHIISSVDHNWLKQVLANQAGGHLSAGLSGPEGSKKILKSELENVCCKLKRM